MTMPKPMRNPLLIACSPRMRNQRSSCFSITLYPAFFHASTPPRIALTFAYPIAWYLTA